MTEDDCRSPGNLPIPSGEEPVRALTVGTFGPGTGPAVSALLVL
jgi:hypothetical protein